MMRQYYLDALIDNLTRSSRTIELGSVMTSVSADKPGSDVSGDLLKKKSRDNARKSAEWLYGIRQKSWSSLDDVKNMYEILAYKINEGIISASPWRTHEINHPGYGCPVKQIPAEMDLFYHWSLYVFNENLPEEEAVTYGAMAEKVIDTNIHPFSDGCGRFAKVVSLYIAMRSNTRVKVYPDRKSYHQSMGKKHSGNDMFLQDNAKEIIELMRSQPFYQKEE